MDQADVLLHHRTYGSSGPPLIILHGLFGALDNWHSLAQRWAQDFQIFALDQRNHGKSPHTSSMSYPEMAQDVRHWMDVHQLERAFVIGHSMGGKTAMSLAQLEPERLMGLLVADIAPRAYPAGHDFILSTLRDFPIDDIGSRKEAEQWMAERIQDPGIRLFLLKNLARKSDGGYVWKMNLPVIERDYKQIIDKIPFQKTLYTPTLVAYGARSGYVEQQDKPVIRRYFPRAQFLAFPDTGHWLHAEQPDLFYQTALDFFKPLAS